ncbi:MAG: hypothetical protein ACD_16C00103G0004 [uncultured bacterium]|nr:MAG: hypothetical protein ACD_16C00103G0004 [uncultured bacterium]OFW70204.1 MAG: hypothetical protein A2X70_00250 [Alphaproteobacteria bacterium GWC2_42_16]OFW73799.1 MAG: hypothetical protein A2Z80_05720 [Alphaproteobacteria bacterium GWA2_41_27]OFW84822.1 MAG: hypothetical protein A2W06_04445 [Alphaproteobacteria bacterium RBG_16_42_14]OFW84936.1 MAG: hypothetical protein A3E50_02020 [Alphaproteobacteria bacterium RIFCSPHIGHO2_12_FULL_42_100]OFW91222.1 MAG: hypothetical protein A3C41_061
MSFPILALAQALTEFVPVMARWLKGDEGEKTAQKIINTAQRVTGEKNPQTLLHILKTNPNLLVDFQEAILKINHDLEMNDYKDREGARGRDIALIHAGRRNLRADIMVIAAALGLVSCLVTISLYRLSLPGETVGIISTIAGIFGSCLKDAYTFEFGSSRGSRVKDTHLSSLINGKEKV